MLPCKRKHVDSDSEEGPDEIEMQAMGMMPPDRYETFPDDRITKVPLENVPAAPARLKLPLPTPENFAWLHTKDSPAEDEVVLKVSDARLIMQHLEHTSPWYQEFMLKRGIKPTELRTHQQMSEWLLLRKVRDVQQLEEATHMSQWFTWFLAYYRAPKFMTAAQVEYSWLYRQSARVLQDSAIPDVVAPSPEQILRDLDKWKSVKKELDIYTAEA